MKTKTIKLIKLSDTHYIVVDDSEIKESDWCYSVSNGLIVEPNKKAIDTINSKPMEGIKFLKITHSTQPLEGDEFTSWFDYIKPLSLSEVEEAINGYSVEKMAEIKYGGLSSRTMCGDDYVDREIRCYTEGFNAHKELVKDKFILSEKDIYRIIDMARKDDGVDGYYHQSEIIQSLLPKTEWGVEFDEQNKLKLI